MRVNGKKITTENIQVEINASEVLSNLYKSTIPSELSFIGTDGFWYVSDGYDYHKREDLYEKVRHATTEELELQKAYKLFLSIAEGNYK